ncbi:MAG: hypothetical protein SGARI_006490, partial [Bacillariaceae sp.]
MDYPRVDFLTYAWAALLMSLGEDGQLQNRREKEILKEKEPAMRKLLRTQPMSANIPRPAMPTGEESQLAYQSCMEPFCRRMMDKLYSNSVSNEELEWLIDSLHHYSHDIFYNGRLHKDDGPCADKLKELLTKAVFGQEITQNDIAINTVWMDDSSNGGGAQLVWIRLTRVYSTDGTAMKGASINAEVHPASFGAAVWFQPLVKNLAMLVCPHIGGKLMLKISSLNEEGVALHGSEDGGDNGDANGMQDQRSCISVDVLTNAEGARETMEDQRACIARLLLEGELNDGSPIITC